MTCYNIEVKLLMRLRMVIFCLNIFKKSDGADYDYVLKDANDFIQDIKLMEQKTNFSLFEDFFWIFTTS